MCAQHRTDGMVDLSVRSHAGNTDGSPSSARDFSPPRTSCVSLPVELREVVPESPADPPAPALAGDSEATKLLASSSSSSSVADALESSSASTRILGSGGGSGGPNTRAAPSPGSSVMNEESLVPEAEPTPATLPDAADLKRGTCEVCCCNFWFLCCLPCYISVHALYVDGLCWSFLGFGRDCEMMDIRRLRKFSSVIFFCRLLPTRSRMKL